MAPVSAPPTTPSVSWRLPADGSRIRPDRPEERRVEEDVADPPADHRAGHDAEDDEQQVVAAEAHPAGDPAGDHEGDENRDRDADRLEADEPVADLQQAGRSRTRSRHPARAPV